MNHAIPKNGGFGKIPRNGEEEKVMNEERRVKSEEFNRVGGKCYS